MKKLLSIFVILFISSKSISQGSNSCLSLNNGGTQQYVTADNILDNFSFSALTVSTWVKPTASNDNAGAIFAFNENSNDFTNNVNLVYFRTDHFEYFDRNPNNFNIPTTGYFPPGNWYHIALVITQNLQGKIYVNGVERLAFNAQEMPVSGDRFSIGQEWDGFDISGLFQGEVDEMRVWDKALSEQQIREEMCKSISPSSTDLVAYYNFDDTSSGGFLTDISSNGNDGTLVTFNSNEFVLSGAPIGDASVFLYPSSWANQTVELPLAPDKYLQVTDVANAPEGVHIYYVASLPNSTQGIDIQVINDYFGVFATNLNAQFSIEYGYGGYGFSCFECDKAPEVFSRNDNAIPDWSAIQAQINVNECSASKSNESSHDLTAREEYIIGKKLGVSSMALLPDSVVACVGTNKVLDVSQSGGISFLWSDTTSNPIYSTTNTGIVWVDVTFPSGCVIRDTAILADLPAPLPFSLGPDQTACIGDSIILAAPLQNNVSYLWSDGTTADSLLVTVSTMVTLAAKNQCGTSSDEVVFVFEDCFKVYMSNSFSPNSDGINDYFNISVKDNLSLLVKRMLIFDRWGEKVFDKSNFKSDENEAGWDGDFKGNPAASDVYVYLIEVVKPDGFTEKLSGELTLLR